MYKRISLLLLVSFLVQQSRAMVPNSFVTSIGIPSGLQGLFMAANPNNRYVYVSCNDGSVGSVIVIDTNHASPTYNTVLNTPNLTGTFSVNIAGIKVTPNGQYVYAANGTSLAVIQASDFTVLNTPGLNNISSVTIPTLAITPDGSRAYVCSPPNVLEIDIASNTLLNTITGSLANPFSIAITPNGDYAYIADVNNNAVYVVDTNPSSPTYNQFLPTVISINQALFLAITPDGQYVYVTDGSNNVEVISISDNAVITPAGLAGSFYAPNGIAMISDGSYAYVSNFLGVNEPNNSAISLIDTNPLSATYNTTIDTPGLNIPGNLVTRFLALVATPDNRYIYAVDNYNGATNIPVVDVFFTGIVVNPPINFFGCKKRNVFMLQTDNINHLTWSAPTTGTPPASYSIYRDAALTQLVATLPASTLEYDDHGTKPNVTYTYYIVGVDRFGNLSTPAVTTVTQNC